MPGPLYAPTVLFLFPFRFRDPVSGKWIRARYLAERSVITERYQEWQITGEAEVRRHSAEMFSPWRTA